MAGLGLQKEKYFRFSDFAEVFTLTKPVEQWFSNCGTRTTSGTRGLFRWYASSFPVIFKKLC